MQTLVEDSLLGQLVINVLLRRHLELSIQSLALLILVLVMVIVVAMSCTQSSH